jgi:hypothetical protein
MILLSKPIEEYTAYELWEQVKTSYSVHNYDPNNKTFGASGTAYQVNYVENNSSGTTVINKTGWWYDTSFTSATSSGPEIRYFCASDGTNITLYAIIMRYLIHS